MTHAEATDISCGLNLALLPVAILFSIKCSQAAIFRCCKTAMPPMMKEYLCLLKIMMLTLSNISAGSALTSDQLLARTTSGFAMGHLVNSNIREFLGIPYGETKRWERAAPYIPSSSTIEASSYGPSCYQDLGSVSGELFEYVCECSSSISTT